MEKLLKRIDNVSTQVKEVAQILHELNEKVLYLMKTIDDIKETTHNRSTGDTDGGDGPSSVMMDHDYTSSGNSAMYAGECSLTDQYRSWFELVNLTLPDSSDESEENTLDAERQNCDDQDENGNPVLTMVADIWGDSSSTDETTSFSPSGNSTTP